MKFVPKALSAAILVTMWNATETDGATISSGSLFETAHAQAQTRVIKKKRSSPQTTKDNKRTRVENLGETVDEDTEIDYTRPSGTGVSAFLGVDGGYVTSSPENPDLESSKSGFNLGIKALASIFTNSMVVDVGGGYLISRLEGAKDTLDDPDGTRTEINDVIIETRIGYFEFSPRVRLGRVFSLGLLGQAFFGEDGRFGPEDPLDDPNSKASATSLATGFAGVTAVLEWMGESLGFRVGVQALTDVNIVERQLLIGQLSLQVGLPIIRQKTIVNRRKVHKVREKIREREVEKVVKEVVVKEVVKFQFDSEFINFETDKAILSGRSRQFLSEVADFLMMNPDIWSRVIIEGHTDIRGSFEYNMDLSRNRAAAVREHLVSAGIPQDRIQSAGYGFTKPLDDRNIPVAWARNRRVEMTFSNVTDPVLLRQGIEAIRNRIKMQP